MQISHNLHAQSSAPSPSIQNDIHTLRVLIGRVENKDKGSLTIKGQALMNAEYEILGAKQLQCTRDNPIASALLQSPSKTHTSQTLRWTYEHQKTTLRVLGSLKVSDRSGFFQVNDKWYRGKLELKDMGQSLLIINHVNLNDYISALLHGEMPKHYELEALKAQAIAARSYAIATAIERRKASSPFDLHSTVYDQVYPGAQSESDKGLKANSETQNKFLVYGGEILKSYYHAASGGHSELPAHVWSGRPSHSFEAYQAQPNSYDKGEYKWHLQLSSYVFESAYPEIGKLVDIQLHQKTSGHRVRSLKLVGSQSNTVITLGSLRNLLSSISLKSLKFEIKKESDHWLFKGEGWGHGVGLSQVAAQNMAKLGKTYREILEHHYPNAQVISLKTEPVPLAR